MSVDANVGVELLATTLTDKDMANVLPNYMLFMQRLEILVTYITEVNSVYHCPSQKVFFSPKLISTGFAGAQSSPQ